MRFKVLFVVSVVLVTLAGVMYALAAWPKQQELVRLQKAIEDLVVETETLAAQSKTQSYDLNLRLTGYESVETENAHLQFKGLIEEVFEYPVSDTAVLREQLLKRGFDLSFVDTFLPTEAEYEKDRVRVVRSTRVFPLGDNNYLGVVVWVTESPIDTKSVVLFEVEPEGSIINARAYELLV